MNHIIHLICLWGFLALPGILLYLRVARSAIIPWWLLAVILSLGGWVLVNGAIHFHYAHLDDLLRSAGDDPSEDMLARRSGDGSKVVFGLYFGWLYGILYSIPWLLTYGLVQMSWRMLHQLPSGKCAE